MADEDLVSAFHTTWDEFPGMARLINANYVVWPPTPSPRGAASRPAPCAPRWATPQSTEAASTARCSGPARPSTTTSCPTAYAAGCPSRTTQTYAYTSRSQSPRSSAAGPPTPPLATRHPPALYSLPHRPSSFVREFVDERRAPHRSPLPIDRRLPELLPLRRIRLSRTLRAFPKAIRDF